MVNNSEIKQNQNKYQKHVWLLGGIDHGNLGDHFIQTSLCEFLKDIVPDLFIQEIPLKEYYEKKRCLVRSVLPQDVLVFCGGGNLGTMWPRLEKLRQDAFSTWPENPKIVFPQSVYFDESDQESIRDSIRTYHDPNCILALRDPVSYGIADRMFSCRKFLTPDIVMYSDRRVCAERDGILLLLRNDKESVLDVDLKEKIRSVLQEYGGLVIESDTVRKYNVKMEDRSGELEQLTDLIASKKLVVTDRLHGMIICAITGTPCIVLSNSYHKIDSYLGWVGDLPYIKHINDVNELDPALKTVDLEQRYSYPLISKRMLFRDFKNATADALCLKEPSSVLPRIKVSVIIPAVHESQQFKQQLDSVIRQPMRELEIICTEAGPESESSGIAAEYAASDHRIRMIRQENSDLSEAENAGIRYASGKYIYLPDRGTILADNMIEICARKMEDWHLDLLCFEGNTDDISVHQDLCTGGCQGILTGKEMMSLMKKDHVYSASASGFFFRKSLLTDNGLSFVNGISHGEGSFIFGCLLTADRAAYCPDQLFYRQAKEKNETVGEVSFKQAFRYYADAAEIMQLLTEKETDICFITEQLDDLDRSLLKPARAIYQELDEKEREKTEDLPVGKIVPFYNLVVLPSGKEAEQKMKAVAVAQDDLKEKEVMIEKLRSELNKKTKELDDIKNSKLYMYMVRIRKIKKKWTDE